MLAYDFPLLGVFWSLLMFALFILWVFIVIWCFVDNFRRRDHHGSPRRSGSSSSCSFRSSGYSATSSRGLPRSKSSWSTSTRSTRTTRRSNCAPRGGAAPGLGEWHIMQRDERPG